MSLDDLLTYQSQMRCGDRDLITVQEMFVLYSEGLISGSDNSSASVESVRAFKSPFKEFGAWVSAVGAKALATRTKLHENEGTSMRHNLPRTAKYPNIERLLD